MRHRNFIITATLSSLALLWLWAGERFPVQPFCIFHKLTGIPCPGCGGVRAVRLLLKGDVLQALYTNPLSIILCVCFAIILCIMFVDCLRNTDTALRLVKKQWRPLPTIIAIIVICANWIWNIFKEL